MDSLQISSADTADIGQLKLLLALHRLPVDDIGDATQLRFLIARDGDHLVGVVGLELYRPVALLRSLVVNDAARRHGLGKRLVDAAEGLARNHGIDALYLLTTDASTYFLTRGYEVADRGDAPDAIKTTLQFAGLCPASLTLMSKAP